jgi:molybdate transport system substrate-binding protein
VAGLAAVVAIGAVHLASGRADDLPIAVLASSSLGPAFAQIDAGPEYSFADSDLLANSLRLGARADVFAAAGADQPQALARQGRIGRPVAFATTRLVLILPRANRRRIGSVYDLGRRGVTTLLGDASLSFGRQSRALLSRLRVRTAGARTARDPRRLAAEVAAGAADAGIVYATDLAGVVRRLRVVSLPVRGRPEVTLEIAVVSGAPHPAAAAAFVRRVLSPVGRTALRRAGFGPV